MIKNIIKSFLTKLKYKGSKYLCPVCGYKAKDFLPAGLYVKRESEKCPQCGSLTRHRHAWLFLEGYFKKRESVTILHFSPEKPIADRLRTMPAIQYFTTQYDRSLKADYHLDIQQIDLPDNHFDVVICSHVLEHIPDDRIAMKEMYRILKPGGCALIMVPLWPSEQHETYENAAIIDPRDRIIHFGQFDHLRIYGLDITERLKKVGFSVEVLDMEKQVNSAVAEKYRLHNNLNIRELIFLSVK